MGHARLFKKGRRDAPGETLISLDEATTVFMQNLTP